jgi:hypothetical protein
VIAPPLLALRTCPAQVEGRLMGLRIQALHVGTITNVSRARMTHDRGYADTATAELLMFAIAGGEHPAIVDTGSATADEVRDRNV